MASFVIKGKQKLSGEIIPQGAKNEALQVICAVLLTDEKVTIHNLPHNNHPLSRYSFNNH
jgi:UDP-N-acetylglucosamine 1-carboxyvinyltransferase